jgi:hypothetical protein
MMAINWKSSWPLVEAAIVAHNKVHVIGTKKNGKPRYDLKMVLRTPHQHLLKELVRLYSMQLARYKWLHLTSALPPFHTNCGVLSNAMGLCKATIHNQLERLLSSGLITEKEHQGRHNNFKLRLADSIVVIHPELEMRREIGLEADLPLPFENQAVAADEARNLEQVPDACSFKKENKLSVVFVDKEASNPALGGKKGASDARLQEASEDVTEAAKSHEKRTEGAQETRLQDSSVRETVAETPVPALVSGYFHDHYIRLLTLIVGTLYSRLDYLAVSQLEAIKAFISSQFDGMSKEECETTYWEIWIRVGMAEKWVGKKPGRYVPLPEWYFSPENPNGFNRTAKWLSNMRMTNERAEKAKNRFQYLTRSITAVLHSTGKHLEERGIQSYNANRQQVTDRYPHLATAFDWIVLDPRCNQAEEN